MTLYQILHDAIHAKSGQEGPLKLQYIRTERESVMGWVRNDHTVPLRVHLLTFTDCRSPSHLNYIFHFHLGYPKVLLLVRPILLHDG